MIKLIIIAVVAILAFLVFRRYYLKHWEDNLEVELFFAQSELVEGETGQLKEIVSNRKRLAVPSLKVAFQTSRDLLFEKADNSKATDQFYHNDVFGLSGGERVTRTFPFVPATFGYYKINNMDIIAYDLFFTVKELRQMKVEEVLYVYPQPLRTEKFAFYLRQLNGDILTQSNTTEDPFEFRGIREYQPYDDIRSINWKATAKTGELKVNQKNPTSTKEIRIFLNLEDLGIRRKDDQVGDCVRVAAGLAQHFIKQGMKTALYANSRDIISGEPPELEANIGTGHMRELCRQLARLNIAEPPVEASECFKDILFRETENVTCFISCNAYEEFSAMLEEYKAAGNEFVWFYVIKAGDTPNISESLRENVRVIKP